MKQKIINALDIAVEFSIYGMIFFIPISIAVLGIFAGSTALFFLAKKILSPDFKSLKDNKLLFIFLFTFFIFMGLSLLNSGPLFDKSLRALLVKWGRFPFLLWAIIETFQDKKRIIRAVSVLLFSALLVGVSTFTQKFFGFEFLRKRPLSESIVTGPFKNQNGLAAYLTCIIPIALSLSLWRWKRLGIQILFILITGVFIAAAIWTYSRGGWGALILGVIFIALLSNCRGKKNAFFLSLFAYIFFCILPFFTAIYLAYGRASSSRLIILKGAWNMIKENPFLGKGTGTFMDYCGQYTQGLSGYYTHNCFLQIWAESGIFSLLAFFLFVGYVFYRSFHSILKVPKSLNSFILIGLSGGLLSFLVHSFFDVHLYSFQLSFLFWIVLGLTVAATNANISRSE